MLSCYGPALEATGAADKEVTGACRSAVRAVSARPLSEAPRFLFLKLM